MRGREDERKRGRRRPLEQCSVLDELLLADVGSIDVTTTRPTPNGVEKVAVAQFAQAGTDQTSSRGRCHAREDGAAERANDGACRPRDGPNDRAGLRRTYDCQDRAGHSGGSAKRCNRPFGRMVIN